MNQILICLLVIELASIKSATYPQRIIRLSLTKDNNISSDGYMRSQLSGQCIDALLNAFTCSFNFNLILAQYCILKIILCFFMFLLRFRSIDTEEIRHAKMENVFF